MCWLVFKRALAYYIPELFHRPRPNPTQPTARWICGLRASQKSKPIFRRL